MTVILLCASDGQRLIPVEGLRNIYYRCPYFYRENRPKNMSPCNNRMSLARADMIKRDVKTRYINGKLESGKNYICGHISYKLARITDKHITVYVRRMDK